MPAPKRCDIKGCSDLLGPGSCAVGYVIDEKTFELKACPFHAQLIRMSGPGSFTITKDRELKPIPAQFFIKKGFR